MFHLALIKKNTIGKLLKKYWQSNAYGNKRFIYCWFNQSLHGWAPCRLSPYNDYRPCNSTAIPRPEPAIRNPTAWSGGGMGVAVLCSAYANTLFLTCPALHKVSRCIQAENASVGHRAEQEHSKPEVVVQWGLLSCTRDLSVAFEL